MAKKWTAYHEIVAFVVIVLIIIGTGQLVSAELSPTPPAVTINPKVLHSGGLLVYPSTSPIGPISEINASLETFDAWAAYNEINMSLVVHMPNVVVGSKVYLVLVETSF